MNEDAIEEILQERGLDAPRLSPTEIQATIAREDYHVFNGVLTICCLTLVNGFTVTGESACVSPENYNKDLGQLIARDNAVDKIWVLEGYLLRSKIHNGEVTTPPAN